MYTYFIHVDSFLWMCIVIIMIDATANGIMQVGIDSMVPCIFGVLTVMNKEQAIVRSVGKGCLISVWTYIYIIYKYEDTYVCMYNIDTRTHVFPIGYFISNFVYIILWVTSTDSQSC